MVSLKHLSADGATALAQQSWPTLAADVIEVVSDKLKFAAENISDRALGASPFGGLFLRLEQVGTNDGKTFMKSCLDEATISKPWGPDEAAPAVTPSAPGAGGVWGASGGPGTYGVKITATKSGGETIGSDEIVVEITSNTQTAEYEWEPVPLATGFKVYRTPTPGTYGATTLIATLGVVTSYIDDGAAPGAGTPPSVNTTGGAGPAYGTPPDDEDFDQTDKAFGETAMGQQVFYWMWIVVPAGTSEIGNRRASRRAFKEI